MAACSRSTLRSRALRSAATGQVRGSRQLLLSSSASSASSCPLRLLLPSHSSRACVCIGSLGVASRHVLQGQERGGRRRRRRGRDGDRMSRCFLVEGTLSMSVWVSVRRACVCVSSQSTRVWPDTEGGALNTPWSPGQPRRSQRARTSSSSRRPRAARGGGGAAKVAVGAPQRDDDRRGRRRRTRRYTICGF